MPRQDLIFAAIEDFSPGIHTNTRYQGDGDSLTSPSHGPDRAPITRIPGIAQETGTVKCVATATGALGPAPRRTLDVTIPEPGDWADSLLYRLTGFDALLSYTVASSNNVNDRVEMHLHLEYQDGADYKSRWYRYRIFDTASPTLEDIQSLTVASVTGEARAVRFQHTRMNPADPTLFGQIVTVACWAGAPGDADERWAKGFPDPASSSTTSTIDVGDPTNHGYTNLVAHQGRVVFNRHLTYERGVGVSLSITDNWYWTDPNDNTLSAADPTPFVYENPQGIADLFSSSANELFAVKTIGGGFVVRGSLDNPTVIQLPNIHSPTQGPRGENFRGCWSSLGVIFCGPDGAYLWAGGDASQKISPQLDGDFFHTGLTCLQYTGAAARWQDWVLFPRNWLFDTTNQSWWKLDDTADADVTWWSESGYRNHMYGAYHSIDNTGSAGDRQVVWRWDYDSPVYDYTWTSQPISNPDGRQIRLREIVVTAQGAEQDITVTVTNEDGETGSGAITWSLDSETSMTRLRGAYAITGRAFTIKVECDGTSGSNAAALIRSIALGIESTTHMPIETT